VGPLRAAALALEFGFIVGSFIVAGVLLGRYLDRLWDTGPWMFITGVLIGMGLSFYVMVLIIRWQQK
jgi:F0F1-type ATP synthase assembly protein I